jgi:Bacterial Ig-like domain (group 3)/Domain of unknown function (DUF4397)
MLRRLLGSKDSKSSVRLRVWAAPAMLILAAYAAFYVFAIVQACHIPTNITPIIDCATPLSKSTYRVFFGYKNDSTIKVDAYPGESSDLFNISKYNIYLPSQFLPGPDARHYVFSVDIDKKDSPTWTVTSNGKTVSKAVNWNAISACQPTLTLTSTPNPSLQTQTVTFTATLDISGYPLPVRHDGKTIVPTPLSMPAPTGQITFFRNTTIVLGSSNVKPATLQAKLDYKDLSSGTWPIIARYSGDSNYPVPSGGPLTSNPPYNQVVYALTPQVGCITKNTDGTFTVPFGYTNSSKVDWTIQPGTDPENFFTPALVGTGLPNIISGTREKFPAGTFLANQSKSVFQVKFDTTSLKGYQTLTWYLTGQKVSVNLQNYCDNGQPSTVTTLDSSPNPSVVGQPVTITAKVVGYPDGTPTGTVTFFDNGTQIGTGTLNSGVATMQTSSLAAGTHPLTAQYAGSGNFPGSTSAVVNQIVNKIDTDTTVVSSVNPSVANQNVTFTATVTPKIGGDTPTGTIQFMIDGTAVGSPVAMSNGQATYSTSTLAVGTHTVRAEYSGSDKYNPSHGDTSQTVNTTPLPPTTDTNAFIRIAQSSKPDGNVDIAIDGQTSMPNVNACTVQTYAPLAPGNHTITVTTTDSSHKTIITKSLSFTAGTYYTLAIVGNSSQSVAQDLLVFTDDQTVITGQSKVRVYHLDDSLKNVDVAANGTVIAAGLAFENATPYLAVVPGNQSFTVTPVNSTTPAISDGLSMQANQVYSIFAMCSTATNTVTPGTPQGMPQTGNAPVSASSFQISQGTWIAIAIILTLLPLLGGGIGRYAALAVIRRRRAQ